ncbi:acylpyruvase [candidate division WOR_3 bacterium SM23_60]|uniref:Acylpyruvase n=1 Tax=candidate division WOR_3 bacterium SM23_60 TaxID=1703780 RepID=A0A0S8G985_UNCW3|nr:MAG: acylpyruvase [candidate division WOR_3 bacterium SM23_60]
MINLPYGTEEIALAPSKIICVAKNYSAHAQEMHEVVPAEPQFFLKPPSALLGDGGVVVLPKKSRRVDHEVELAVIMQSGCRCVSAVKAMNHILGYTVTVDITARDLQAEAKKRGMPWTIAKGFDTFAPVGPCIMPAESIDPCNLPIWLTVNGDMRQKSTTAHMIHPVAELISFISHIMTLEPHDILCTGTPEGVGPLHDGDSVEAGIDGIGILRFSVEQES